MNRPDLEVMWLACFDEDTDRVRPEVRRLAVVDEQRCRRRGHLLAVVLRTNHGRWVAWRSSESSSTWGQEWLDSLPDQIETYCHCDRRRARRVDLAPYRDAVS